MAQNKNTNTRNSEKKTDPNTWTAYGDPVKTSKPTSNNQFKKGTSGIAESTQEGKPRKD